MRLMHRYVKHFLILLALFMQTVSAQSVANPKVTYFHNDITGTAVAATDEKGEVIWREQRRAYGEIKVDPLKPKSLDEFSVGYTGHQADKESGLTYAKARYYNKAIGRFYAPDPIPFRENDLVSINRYAYAGNNPYKYVDPTGMEGEDLIKELRQARRGGKTAKEFEKDTNEFLKDSVKIAAVTGAEAGGGKFLGKFFSWLGSTKKAEQVCFVKGTLVETPSGKTPIESIKIGDWVLSKNDATGEKGYKQVKQLFRNKDKLIYELSVVNEQGETEVIGTTAEHPFYVQNSGWIEAHKLFVGNKILTADDEVATVSAVNLLSKRQDTYNFEVEDFHTYFVGKSQLWVHNDCGGAIIKSVTKKGITKEDILFKDRNKAMNWAREQLGHNTEKMRNESGQIIGWKNAENDMVYWNHGDWNKGLGSSTFPHLNYKIGDSKGHLYLEDKIKNTDSWDSFKSHFGL